MNAKDAISDTSLIRLLCLMTTSVLAFSSTLPGETQEKISIKSADDLPKHTYKIEGTVSSLVQSEEQLNGFVEQVRTDIQADLDTYDIQDSTALRDLYESLMSIAMLEGRYDDALAYIPVMRHLEDKESKRLLLGLVFESIATARWQPGTDDAPSHESFKAVCLQKLSAVPWAKVGDQIEASKGRIEMMSQEMITGLVKAQLDPFVAHTGDVSADVAKNIINMAVALRIYMPIREDLISVYGTVIERHRTTKEDIWAERSVTLSADQDLTPVTVAVWDTGTDTTQFPGQLFTNPGETLDGQDNDQNGFVDDVHGIAFDLECNRTPQLLFPVDQLHSDPDSIFEHFKGFLDMRAAIDSPEASAFRQVLAGLKPDGVQNLIEDLTLYAAHMHGTHVAGIMVAGNPFARILVARLTADHRVIGQKPTVESSEKLAAAFRDTIDYFRRHEVRIVNMSWHLERQSIESGLEAHGVGESPAERAEMARTLFKTPRDALYTAMAGAPEILFINAAGNSDNDIEFADWIPSGFDLHNLLVVGAVDQAGDPTAFTSFGKTVNVYANGFEVSSCVPGGKQLKGSGTSMSSPNVANLAAKILALRPQLDPAQVIEFIKRGADSKRVGSRTILLINPKKTIELLSWQR